MVWQLIANQPVGDSRLRGSTPRRSATRKVPWKNWYCRITN